MITDCGWNLAKDVTADSFQAWLQGQHDMKDKTANDYLGAMRCFFNWLVKLGRAVSNPLLSVEKAKTKEGRADETRALSDDEMLRLLAVAGERRPVYLMAVHTGPAQIGTGGAQMERPAFGRGYTVRKSAGFNDEEWQSGGHSTASGIGGRSAGTQGMRGAGG